MPERLPDGSRPSDYWRILELMRQARSYFPDFWPPWNVSSWEDEDERELEMHHTIERTYWEDDD